MLPTAYHSLAINQPICHQTAVSTSNRHQIVIRDLGCTDYLTTLTAMQAFTQNRMFETPDECWFTQHASVYTLGLNRKDTRLPNNNIPLVLADRGGKITYHGLGQVIIYLLINLKRRNLIVRQLVTIMESSIIELLAQHKIIASVQKNAPGVYVNVDGCDKKIASLGLRLKNQCCYHGLSLNVNMDLSPFSAIDPCGYAGLLMTQTQDLGLRNSTQEMGECLIKILQEKLQLCLSLRKT